MTELRTILAQRERLYSPADATIDTSQHDEAQCLQELLTTVHELTGDAWPGPVSPATEESPD